MKLVIVISKIRVVEGDGLPPWYYGFSYDELYSENSVFCIIPLNFLVRWSRHLGNRWDYYRQRGDSFHKRMRALIKHHQKVGYYKGLDNRYQIEVNAK